jgi:hypothetical protein
MNNHNIDEGILAVYRMFHSADDGGLLTDDTKMKVHAFMLIASLLGEIAKRLPEPKDPS